MPRPETGWLKSSYSMQNGDCVEVRHTGAGTSVRDSKRPEARLTTTPAAWAAFLTRIQVHGRP
ncbi:DUF397 domain-containing protein [Streptomyces durbertensis]|uniref:DUF397 domain-containing protein n=1 Tax=Streptomyces durbertensis TaxID=2448886 RepID=A0ABR6EER8_9ACTN|nr:DUF397 domain-containing protein [Streptomyces durbertensis]MBB1243821.1 DUF397 domain-containing protein [Streptomyces durbertensis]